MIDLNFADIINIVRNAFIEHPIWQSIWLVAFLVSIYNFLFCKNKKFIYVTAIASFVWGIHFYSIWLMSAALVNAVDVGKNLLAIKYKRSIKLSSIFVVFYLVLPFFIFDWYISLIPMVTAILWTYLVFYVRWVWLNVGFLFIIMMWFTYNYIWRSVWWSMTDLTLFISGIVGVFRTFVFKKGEK